MMQGESQKSKKKAEGDVFENTRQAFFDNLKKAILWESFKCVDLKDFNTYIGYNKFKKHAAAYVHINTDESNPLTHKEIREFIESEKKGTAFEKKFFFDFGTTTTFVRYHHNNKVNNEKDFLNLIQRNPKGVFVEQELVSNTFIECWEYYKSLLYSRVIFPLRTRRSHPNAYRNQAYYGFYVFSMQPEIKEVCQGGNIYLRNSKQEKIDEYLENDKVFLTWFQTKSSTFRPLYEQVCRESLISLFEDQREKTQTSESKSISAINARAIPNLAELIAQYCKENEINQS